MQVHLREAVGLVPDPCSKAKLTIRSPMKVSVSQGTSKLCLHYAVSSSKCALELGPKHNAHTLIKCLIEKCFIVQRC